MKKILLTGAAGSIGTSLRKSLGHEYHFRCLDVKPIENSDDVFTADIMDFESLLKAMQGMDAVIHLAANCETNQPWQDVLGSGIDGTYNVFDAARRVGVKQVIYASSTAVLGWSEMQLGQKVSPDMAVHPRTLYGIGKATGELLARYFVDAYQMSIICLRIGLFSAGPPFPQIPPEYVLRGWCSPEDLAQLVQRCLETDGLGFQVFYGVSNNSRRLWSLDNARKLVGYRPTNNAENFIKASGNMRERLTLSKEHILLMRAAVQDDLEAYASWQQWLEKVDIENTHLESISYRLLPLVYENLAKQHVDHPLMTRLKGVYRRAWLENQLSLQKLIPLIAFLHDRHIPVLLLDDLTSILRLYDGQGMRRPYTLDILVHPEDVPRLLDIFMELKIWPKVSQAEQFLTVETPLELWTPFDLPLTVAWRVFPRVKTHNEALTAWQAANSSVLGEYPVFTLDLETHFLRSCLRAVGAKPEAAFFALVDVAWMLRKQAPKMDWGRVVELARINHLILPVIETFEAISAFMEMPGVNELLPQFQILPVSWMDRLEHRVIHSYRPFPNLFIRVIRRLLLYRISPKMPGLLGFPRYLQIVWGGIRLLSLPGVVVRQFGRNLLDHNTQK